MRKTLGSNRIAYVVVTAFDRNVDIYESHHDIDIDPAKLPVGKFICILEAQPWVKMAFAKYKIKRNDTFFSISKMDSNLMEQIMSLSPDVDAGNLPVGKSICVPASCGARVKGMSNIRNKRLQP